MKLLTLGIIILVGYVYFSNGTPTQAVTDAITSSANSSPGGNPMASPAVGTNVDSQIAQDTSFLATLTSLTRIKIDNAIFSNDAFNALKNNEVIIEPVVPGRVNPFAPIGAGVSSGGAGNVITVVTGDSTDITSTTVTLNGTTASNATSSYFEYGTTPTLGKTSAPSLTTLVGSFSSKITGLTPKSTYFFRAASKVGSATLYGAVATFNTN